MTDTIRALRTAAEPFHFPGAIVAAAEAALLDCRDAWSRREATALEVSGKVAAAFARAGLDEGHLAGSAGYAYHDRGREAYEALLADILDAPAALARVQLVSGTHAIVATIAALARSGERLCMLTGRPYDTLHMALAQAPRALANSGIEYYETPWLPDEELREADVAQALRRQPHVVFIQRSRGYAPRRSLSVAEIGGLIKSVRELAPKAWVVVDNCYGELVELREPGSAGADVAVGSLIKNPGGGMAMTGAYVAGTPDAIARVADRVFAPGLGNSVGPTLDVQRWLFAGLHRAPRAVAESLKTLDFAAALFARLGFAVSPKHGEHRTDIIQAIRLGKADKVIAFARGLQRLLPVNAKAMPEPGPVPGYAEPVIMAGGAFVSGSTLELSCDAPMRAPFEMYLQGGMDTGHGILATMSAASAVMALS
jgi:cystathionine beta-lyase family protein involved in aluminum resistance